MAKTSMKVKQQRKQKFSSREYNRCRICCVFFRELSYKGQIPGVKKASW